MVRVVLSFSIALSIQPLKKIERSHFEGKPKFLTQNGASLAVVDRFALFSTYKQDSTSC